MSTGKRPTSLLGLLIAISMMDSLQHSDAAPPGKVPDPFARIISAPDTGAIALLTRGFTDDGQPCCEMKCQDPHVPGDGANLHVAMIFDSVEIRDKTFLEFDFAAVCNVLEQAEFAAVRATMGSMGGVMS